jgi:hypothetical protein
MASVAARKRMIVISWVVAGLVALASIADLALGVPFNRQVVMDVMFLLGAALVGYLAFDAYKDIT